MSKAHGLLAETTSEKNNFQNIRQLQVLAIKISHLAKRSEALLKTSTVAAVTEGLIAVGLCKQAKEQIAAACQNLGFAAESLTQIITSNSSDLENKLCEATARVVEVIQQIINVPDKAITPGINGFIEELLVIAAVTASRAEEHVKKGEKLLQCNYGR